MKMPFSRQPQRRLPIVGLCSLGVEQKVQCAILFDNGSLGEVALIYLVRQHRFQQNGETFPCHPYCRLNKSDSQPDIGISAKFSVIVHASFIGKQIICLLKFRLQSQLITREKNYRCLSRL